MINYKQHSETFINISQLKKVKSSVKAYRAPLSLTISFSLPDQVGCFQKLTWSIYTNLGLRPKVQPKRLSKSLFSKRLDLSLSRDNIENAKSAMVYLLFSKWESDQLAQLGNGYLLVQGLWHKPQLGLLDLFKTPKSDLTLMTSQETDNFFWEYNQFFFV